MTNDRAEPEVVEAAPVVKSRLSLVVLLSILLGVLLTVGAVGMFLHFKASNVLQAEVLAAKNELKIRDLALDDMRAQIKALSSQMHALKEYSIARSSRAGEKTVKVEGAVSTSDAVAVDAKEKKAWSEAPVQLRTKKPKSDKPNCELVGKSPEEQAATLRRCVTLIDPQK